MNKKIIIYLIPIFCIFYVNPLTVGSNTAFSRQPFITFPAADANNNLRGFASFEKGFALADQTTTTTYDSFFPLSGAIFLNGGGLILNQDLTTTNSFVMATGGCVVGNGHSFECEKQSTNFFFPAQNSPTTATFKFIDTTLVLNNDIVFTRPILFQGVCRVNGRGFAVTFGSRSSLIVQPDTVLIIENTILNGLQDGKFSFRNDGSFIELCENVINLDANFTFTQGSILFAQDVSITGTGKFIYAAKLSSSIDSLSTLFIDNGMTFSYNPRVANKGLLFMTDATSGLYLNGCTLHSTRTGIQLSNGILFFDNKVTLSSEAKNSGEALALKSDLNVQVLSGANVQVSGLVKI